MAVRISGLVSGLDTDSIVKELVSAYSTKKDKYVKSQTKLDWKMDAWKDLNKKVNSLYKQLGNLKLSSAYVKKTTVSSDPAKALVSASNTAINGSQSLKINQVAKTGYITGGKLTNVSGSTKLSELTPAISGSASIAVTSKGTTKNIELTDNMSVNDVVNKLKDAGISANFDEANKRMYISAKDSGVANDFSLIGTDANGISVLQGLGVYVDKPSNTAAFQAWKDYAVYQADGVTIDEDATKAQLTTYLENIRKYQWGADQDSLVNGSTINQLDADGNVSDRENSSIKFLQTDTANKVTENRNLIDKITYANSYYELDKALTTDNLSSDEQIEIKELLTKQDELTEDEKQRLNELKTTLGVTEEDWEKIGAYASVVKGFEGAEENAADVTLVKGSGADGITAVTDNWLDKMKKNETEISANQTSIAEKNSYIGKYTLLTGAAPENDTTTMQSRVDTLMDKINFAAAQLSSPGAYSSDATIVKAQDAIIELNDVVYTSSSSNITVNGLTITALQETKGEEITISTQNNSQGIYDTVKDFLKQYNELIKEMDKLYNASSAKGYEPLTDDEKDAMSDKEVDKWEQKIKDSILRRDDRLSSVMNTMTMAMSKSFTLGNGKTYSLSSFGIKTQGYFAAEENEGSVFHIDGDEDDEITSGNADRLLAAIQEDPESVQEFFQTLTGNLYTELDGKMKSSTTSHSAFTIYNDKTMKKEYDDYTKTIKKWEEKIKNLEDYYYKKFSAMETALSKLQSSTNALSGLLGTS